MGNRQIPIGIGITAAIHIILGNGERELWLGTEGAEDDIKSDFTEYH